MAKILKFAHFTEFLPLQDAGYLKVTEGEMETYLTIEEVAGYLKLAVQTIRRYVLNREIPFYKIKKVIRFRLSEIEAWIAGGAVAPASSGIETQEGDLFKGDDTAETEKTIDVKQYA